MESDFIQFLSFAVSSLIVILGWNYNKYKERQFEIFKRRLDKRTLALHSALPILLRISNHGNLDFPEAKDMLGNTRSLFQLYCNENEIEIYEGFINALEEKNLDLAQKHYSNLSTSVVNSIRKDLGLNSIFLKRQVYKVKM